MAKRLRAKCVANHGHLEAAWRHFPWFHFSHLPHSARLDAFCPEQPQHLAATQKRKSHEVKEPVYEKRGNRKGRVCLRTAPADWKCYQLQIIMGFGSPLNYHSASKLTNGVTRLVFVDAEICPKKTQRQTWSGVCRSPRDWEKATLSAKLDWSSSP